MVWWPIFFLHGSLMAIDEFYLHRKRGLSSWERWGHPLDTITVLLPIGLLLISADPPLGLYVAMAVFSSLFVTKDEKVHREHCTSMEHWLHALLFLMHPVVFYAAWQSRSEPLTLKIFVSLSLGFLGYQIVYWNWAGRKACA